MPLSGAEPRCEMIDEWLLLGVADGGAPTHHLFDRSRPARGGEPLLFNHIGVMAREAHPLVGGRSGFRGNMRRHGLWREMLRKIGLKHLALLRSDLRSPADHLVDRIRPTGQRESLRRDDVGFM